MIEFLPTMNEGLGSIPSSEGKNNEKRLDVTVAIGFIIFILRNYNNNVSLDNKVIPVASCTCRVQL